MASMNAIGPSATLSIAHCQPTIKTIRETPIGTCARRLYRLRGKAHRLRTRIHGPGKMGRSGGPGSHGRIDSGERRDCDWESCGSSGKCYATAALVRSCLEG